MREELAAVQHEIWSHWMTYLFSVSDMEGGVGIWIEMKHIERWLRQMDTPYNELSEQEKDSDREQADKVLALLKEYCLVST